MTNYLSQQRRSFFQNRFALAVALVFVLLWVYCYVMNTDELNWWIENILVLLFVPFFLWLQKRFTLSDWSLLSLFLFLMIHTYGAKNAYTYNTFGEWLQAKYQLVRNPYDRIVHTSFGVLICYPMLDVLYNKYKVPFKWAFLLTNAFVLCMATIFELIEWLVAATTDSETGETYVATQGDVWDAHKDILLAWIGSMVVGFIVKKTSGKLFVENK